MRFTLLLFPVALTLLLAGCSKCDDPCNKECDNYDPCCEVRPNSASFKIYENVPWPGSNISSVRITNTEMATDTIIYTNSATFRADYDAEYYQWKVGSDTREWNTKEFSLGFRSVPHYTPVTVTLKVYNPTDKICNPEAEDTAVFTRTLVTVPRDSSLIFGRFDGYIEGSPSNPLFFELKRGVGNDPFNSPLDTVRTILTNCEIVLDSKKPRLGYRNFYFWTPMAGNCCYLITTYGEISRKDNITIKFVHHTEREDENQECAIDYSKEVHGVFNGKRTN